MHIAGTFCKTDEFAPWFCIAEMPAGCRKTPYSCARNGTLKNLLSAFICSGCSMLMVKQAELHLIRGLGGAAAEHDEGSRKRPVWEVLKDPGENLGEVFWGSLLNACSFLFLLCLPAGKSRGNGRHLLVKKMLQYHSFQSLRSCCLSVLTVTSLSGQT